MNKQIEAKKELKEKVKTEKQDKLSWDEYHQIVNDSLREENQSCSTCEQTL